MIRWLTLLLFFVSVQVSAQGPVNDDIADAINITTTRNFCSEDAAYNNIGATSNNGPSKYWNGRNGNDVWFKFTATKSDLRISITGKAHDASPNSLEGPLTAVYLKNPTTGVLTEVDANVYYDISMTILYAEGLTLGQIYFVRVGAWDNSEGNFKFCLENYPHPLPAGPDCDDFSIICSMGRFTQVNVTGPGEKPNEVEGSCLITENNSSWYKWTVAKSGVITFLITPTSVDNDIDWVLYDLGPEGDCSKVGAATVIRCASGHGVNCNPYYYITGLSLLENDLEEGPGCGENKNGLVKYIDAIEGHTYALIIDNYTSGDRGFSVNFTGNAELVGPTSKISVEKIDTCTPQQHYVFTSEAADYDSIKWSFGEGASIATSTSEGAIDITYSTPGEKTITLEAITNRGCNILSSTSILVGTKPAQPSITPSTTRPCAGDLISLSTPKVPQGIYHWTGPNGFSSEVQNPQVTITGPESAGNYQLIVQVGECTSNVETLNIPFVDAKMEANFDIIVNKGCTADQTFTFKNRSTNYATYTWDFGNGVASTTTAANGDITVTYAAIGLKEVKLNLTSPNGCTANSSQKIDVQFKPATPIVKSNRSKFCLGDVLKLSVDEIENATYRWIGPSNFTANTPVIEIPINAHEQAGNYSVVLTVGNCSSDATSFIVPPIAKVPIASFTTTPNYAGKYVAPFPIIFNNKSKNADTYLWDFGDGKTSTEVSPTHTFTQPATYRIRLTAFAEEGCENSIDIGELIIKDATLFIPNSFSPNGDGINDELIITVLNLKKYNILIYNRSGENIFQSTNIFDNWKGKYKNQDVPVGVYYYVIYGTNVFDIAVKYTGSLTLIR